MSSPVSSGHGLLKIDLHKQRNKVNEIALGSSANVFSEKLHEWAAKDARVCYVGVDTMDSEFERKYPDRAFDVGIAEQSELALATGLALSGLIPIIQGWSPFTPLRNFDQLRTYLCRHRCNAKIISWTLGLANCSHGTTHHDLESVALYRVVPNLTVLSAFDDAQFRQAFDAAMTINGPVALLGCPEHYAPGADGLMDPELPPHPEYVVGQSQWLLRGTDATIVTYGSAIRYAWKAAKALDADGINVGMIHTTAIKPFDSKIIEEAARESGALLTVEEQSIVGGVGSAVAEVLAEHCPGVPMIRMGINDVFVEDVGDWTYTRQAVGLTDHEVVRRVHELINQKQP